MTQTVAAVIVTYNRAEKLARVLDALAAQTRVPDRIYVLDNASTDSTVALMDERKSDSLRHLRLARNVGGAGGFNAGIKAAFADGFDQIWISDDDAYPEPDAMEKLIAGLAEFEEETGYKPSFACSAVRWKDGSWCEMNTPATVWDWPRFYGKDMRYFLVRSCSFVSVLVPRWAIRAHGFPIKDYFIWFDDAEYTQRLAKSYPGIFVPDSLVIHDVEVNQGVNYGMITDKSLWKFRHGARNETSFRLREQGMVGVMEFLYQVHVQMAGARLPWKLRRPVYFAIWRGLWFRPKIEMPRQDMI
ncbi:MAG: glycosyltransferase family 2 protein [Rhodobacteraceae bacterium]|nr:glycosyltransferase family 2 protein [Paracoccaceae bacterium]